MIELVSAGLVLWSSKILHRCPPNYKLSSKVARSAGLLAVMDAAQVSLMQQPDLLHFLPSARFMQRRGLHNCGRSRFYAGRACLLAGR